MWTMNLPRLSGVDQIEELISVQIVHCVCSQAWAFFARIYIHAIHGDQHFLVKWPKHNYKQSDRETMQNLMIAVKEL